MITWKMNNENKKKDELFTVKSIVSAPVRSRVYRLYSINTKTPLTQTLSHKGEGTFPPLMGGIKGGVQPTR